MDARFLLLFPVAAPLTLAGCVAQDGFPSLAPRAGERDLSAEAPARAPLDLPSDAALRQRLDALLGEVQGGDRAFEAALPAAEAAAAAAGAEGSDSWVAAQQTLSRLEAARAPATRALAELDGLAVARADRPTAAGDAAAIDAAVERAEMAAARQQARIDRLRARLSDR